MDTDTALWVEWQQSEKMKIQAAIVLAVLCLIDAPVRIPLRSSAYDPRRIGFLCLQTKLQMNFHPLSTQVAVLGGSLSASAFVYIPILAFDSHTCTIARNQCCVD